MVIATDELGPRAGRLPLIGGELALDFCNTASGRDGPTPLDHLTEAGHVLVWMRHAGVIDADAAETLDAAVAAGAAELADLSGQARHLRELLFRVVTPIARHGAPAAADLDAFRDALATALGRGHLGPAGAGYDWDFAATAPSPTALFGPILVSAERLLRERDLARLKCCDTEHCGWLFYDRSKNNSRRWCEMSVCGNRAKARRFRAPKAFVAEAIG